MNTNCLVIKEQVFSFEVKTGHQIDCGKEIMESGFYINEMRRETAVFL